MRLPFFSVWPPIQKPAMSSSKVPLPPKNRHCLSRTDSRPLPLPLGASTLTLTFFFFSAHIPLFLYPFLNTTSKSRPFEYLRLTSLGVIGALVKSDSPPTIEFLLSTEIIPLCLRIMETGSELSKTVAIFILQKVLLDDEGLQYICGTYERFQAVASVLSHMVEVLVEQQAVRLLKHVVRCYLRLSDHLKYNSPQIRPPLLPFHFPFFPW